MPKTLRNLFFLILVPGLMTLHSCVPASKVQRDGLMLDRNRIVTDNRDLSVEDLESFYQQEPNPKTLGLFRLSTFFYERFKPNWIRKSLGKKPVILDTMMVHNTIHDMNLYMRAKGFFEADITYRIDDKRGKIAVVNYIIHSGRPHTIRDISYSINGEELAGLIEADRENSLIRSGNNFDTYLLDDERNRITHYLRNNGYFFFSREFILFKVDSNLNSHQMDIIFEFLQPTAREQQTGQLIEKQHRRYKINDITVNTDFRISRDEYIQYDTLSIRQWARFPERPYQFHILFREKLRLKPSIIDRFTFTRGGRFYRIDDANLTHSRLSSLPLTRFVNLYFEPTQTLTDDGHGMLNGFIDLGRNPVQAFSIEAEGTNTGGYLGIGSNFVYSNRNIFRGGELFSVKFKLGLEMQSAIGESDSYFLSFNTVETGVEARLSLPTLLMPGRRQKYTRHTPPITTFTTGLNYQRRPDYTRYIINFSFGYEWRETITKSHVFIPSEINSIKIFKSDEFSEWLAGLQDQRLVYQFTDHMVPLFRYVFTFNNQPIKKNQDFSFVRTSFESSGNMLYLFNNILDSPQSSGGFYTMFGIRYAQFLKGDIDFRHYKLLRRENILVFRAATGLGVPYGNSDVLPVEKGFYAGGANGIRGWEVRTLGPGSFNDPDNVYDKMGEIWLEGNIEYRFPIYSFLKGAMFMDAGNIWLIQENLDYPGGEFEFSDFYKEIALATGLGLRLDFRFFIVRVDAGLKLKDPAKEPNDRWLAFSKLQFRDIILNFGIGYPF